MTICGVVITMNLCSFDIVFIDGEIDIVVVNVNKAVKNQWAGDTFFTLILKVIF